MLFAAGSNAHGQLGLSHTEDVNTWTPVPLQEEVLEIAAGANHTLFLCRNADGQTVLYGAGDARKGQLGPRYSAPTQPLSRITLQPNRLAPITRIASAWETSFLVCTELGQSSADVIVAYGSNDFGLMHGLHDQETNANAGDLKHVLGDEFDIAAISAGPRHVLTLCELHSGVQKVVGWGASRNGQLGLAAQATFQTRPVVLELPHDHRILQIAAGLGLSGVFTSTSDGKFELHIFGNKQSPQIIDVARVFGLGTDWQIKATWRHVYLTFQAADKRAITLAKLSTKLPSRCLEEHTVAGSLQAIAAGSEHVLMIAMDKAWAVGWNEHGNLGLGHQEPATRPTTVSDISVKRVFGGNGTSWLLSM